MIIKLSNTPVPKKIYLMRYGDSNYGTAWVLVGRIKTGEWLYHHSKNIGTDKVIRIGSTRPALLGPKATKTRRVSYFYTSNSTPKETERVDAYLTWTDIFDQLFELVDGYTL